MSNKPLLIKNKGKEIIETNCYDIPFFETFLSFNAKTLRLLIPEPLKEEFSKELQLATDIEVIFYDYEIKIWLKDKTRKRYIIRVPYHSTDIKLDQKVNATEFISYTDQENKITKFMVHKVKIRDERGKKLYYEE